MDGQVRVLEFPGVRVHLYSAPAEVFAVNVTTLELTDRLIVVDGQMFQQYAAEAADVIAAIGKPIDRFVLTHDHPDHYSGLATLTARFPGVQVAALPGVRDSMLDNADTVLAVRRGMLGDQIAEHPVIPDATILPGRLTIAGQRFEFAEFDDAESEHSLVIYLPDSRLALTGDLVGGATEHLFTLRPHFDVWEQALHRIRADVARLGIDTIIPGHGGPLTPAVIPANIAYLRTAKQVFDAAGTPEEYATGIAEAMPDRGPQGYLDWILLQLFGQVVP